MICRGSLILLILGRRNSISSSSLVLDPGFSDTKAIGTSPHFSSPVPNDGDFGNGRMIEQFLFDLRRIDVDAAADDHVFAAACNIEEPVFVTSRQVAGVEPSFGVEHLGGGRRIVPIAPANMRSTQTEFANLVGCGLIPFGIDGASLP